MASFGAAHRRQSLVRAGYRIAAFGAGIAVVGYADGSRLVLDMAVAVMGVGMLIPPYAIWRFRRPKDAVGKTEKSAAVSVIIHYLYIDQTASFLPENTVGRAWDSCDNNHYHRNCLQDIRARNTHITMVVGPLLLTPRLDQPE